jgi:hypothetical protein
MEHDIRELDSGGLREFGLTTGGIVAGLFGLFFPWLLERPIPRWPWVIAGVLCAHGPWPRRPPYGAFIAAG